MGVKTIGNTIGATFFNTLPTLLTALLTPFATLDTARRMLLKKNSGIRKNIVDRVIYGVFDTHVAEMSKD